MTPPRFSMSWLDLKLAMRMLVRYPVLTVIGAGSLAAAIAPGASAFAFISLFLWPRMPLPDGDQIVLVFLRDVAANQPESRIMGRTLTDDDASAAAPPVRVLGERIWRERFAADPGIVGKTLLVTDTPTTVVGIMPAEFRSTPSTLACLVPARRVLRVDPISALRADEYCFHLPVERRLPARGTRRDKP